MSKYFKGAGYYLIEESESFKGFFQMNTASEFAVRGVNVVLEPLVLLVKSAFSLLVAGYQTLAAIKEVFSGKPDKAENDRSAISGAGACLMACPIFLITALLSPLLNLIDILGSAIKKILPEGAENNNSMIYR